VTRPERFRTSTLALALIQALYAALALAYNVADPVFEPPDELLHDNFIRDLLGQRALPVVSLTIHRLNTISPPCITRWRHS